MSDFLSTNVSLTLDIGSGWISRYEAGNLRPGQIIRSLAMAGEAQRLRLNGEYFCDASLAIAGGRFFARIERLEPELPPPPLPERGNDATELLPFSVRLAEAPFRLEELSGLGRGSYIDLGKDWAKGDDARLVVAGLPFAEGKVAVIGENMGLRISKSIVPPYDEPEIRTTGAVLEPGYAAEPVKDYDFRMPDCFTRRGILRAGELHLELLRTLQARLPAASGYRLALVDQLAYHEWRDERASTNGRFALLGTTPARSRETGTLPAKLLARPSSASTPLEAGTERALHSYAETSYRPLGRRPIIAAFFGSATSLAEEDPGLGVLASCLRNAWKRVADLRVEGSPVLSQDLPGEEAAYPGEMILMARLESEKGCLDLVYPIRTLEACFEALNA